MGANASRPRRLKSDARPIHVCFARTWDEMGKGKTPTRKLHALLASHGLPVHPIMRQSVGLHLLALQDRVKESGAVVVLVRNQFLREILEASKEELDGLEPASWVFWQLRWAVKWQKRVVVVLWPGTDQVTVDILQHLAPSIRPAFADCRPLQWCDSGEESLLFGKRVVEALGGTYKGIVPVAVHLRSVGLAHLVEPSVTLLNLFTTNDLHECMEEDFERVGIHLTDTDRSQLGLAKRVCKKDQWDRESVSPVLSVDGKEEDLELSLALNHGSPAFPAALAAGLISEQPGAAAGLNIRAGNWTGTAEDALTAVQQNHSRHATSFFSDKADDDLGPPVGLDDIPNPRGGARIGRLSISQASSSEGSETTLDISSLAKQVGTGSRTHGGTQPLYDDIESPIKRPQTPVLEQKQGESRSSTGHGTFAGALAANKGKRPATADSKRETPAMSEVLKDMTSGWWSTSQEKQPILPVTSPKVSFSAKSPASQAGRNDSDGVLLGSRAAKSDFEPAAETHQGRPSLSAGNSLVLSDIPQPSKQTATSTSVLAAPAKPTGRRVLNAKRDIETVVDESGDFVGGRPFERPPSQAGQESGTVTRRASDGLEEIDLEEPPLMPKPPPTMPPPRNTSGRSLLAARNELKSLRERHAPTKDDSFRSYVVEGESSSRKKSPKAQRKPFKRASDSNLTDQSQKKNINFADFLVAEPSAEDIEDLEDLSNDGSVSSFEGVAQARPRSGTECFSEDSQDSERSRSPSPTRAHKRNRLHLRSAKATERKNPAGRALMQGQLEHLVPGLCEKLGIYYLHELKMVTRQHLRSIKAEKHYDSFAAFVASFGDDLKPPTPPTIDINGSLNDALQVAGIAELARPLKTCGITTLVDLQDANKKLLITSVEQLERTTAHQSFRLARLMVLRDRVCNAAVTGSAEGSNAVSSVANPPKGHSNGSSGPLHEALQDLMQPSTSEAAAKSLFNASMTPTGRQLLMSSGALDALLSAVQMGSKTVAASAIVILDNMLEDQVCLDQIKETAAVASVVNIVLQQIQNAVKGRKAQGTEKMSESEETAAAMLKMLGKLYSGSVSPQAEGAFDKNEGLPLLVSVLEWFDPSSELCREALCFLAEMSSGTSVSEEMAKRCQEQLGASQRIMQRIARIIPEKYSLQLSATSKRSTQEALRILTSVTRDHADSVVRSGAVPRLVSLLHLSQGKVLLAATKLVETLSGASQDARDALAKQGALVHLSALRNVQSVRAHARKAAEHLQQADIDRALAQQQNLASEKPMSPYGPPDRVATPKTPKSQRFGFFGGGSKASKQVGGAWK